MSTVMALQTLSTVVDPPALLAQSALLARLVLLARTAHRVPSARLALPEKTAHRVRLARQVLQVWLAKTAHRVLLVRLAPLVLLPCRLELLGPQRQRRGGEERRCQRRWRCQHSRLWWTPPAQQAQSALLARLVLLARTARRVPLARLALLEKTAHRGRLARLVHLALLALSV
jgi:hypothetical protein